VLCSAGNYGYVGPIGPLAQGERLVIALTKIETGHAAINYSLGLAGPYEPRAVVAGSTPGRMYCPLE
jgi:hypothetical protein